MYMGVILLGANHELPRKGAPHVYGGDPIDLW